jgi:hypothetical protein
VDAAQRDAVALLTRQLRRWPEESLRRLAEAGPLTVAMVARAVLDLRPATDGAAVDEELLRAVFPHRTSQ